MLNVPIATVSLIDRDRQWLKAKVGLEGGQCPRAAAFCNITIQSREIMVVEDALLDSRFVDNCHVTGDPFIRSYAGAPLMTNDGYNLGALCAIDRVPRTFPANHLAILKRFAGLVVSEMELRTEAQEDYLTRALTRRAFLGRITSEMAHSADGHHPVGLVMFDIDHFKRINDQHGHGVGDDVLRSVADAIRGELQAGECFGRLGGEEFAVLTTGPHGYAAHRRAEQFRHAIATLRRPGQPPVTASFGSSELRPGRSVGQTLAAVDAALYAAKRAGRNRCIAAHDLDDDAAAA